MPGLTTGPSPRWSYQLDEAVTALTWSPDGASLWAGTALGALRILDRTGRSIGLGPPHRRRIVTLATDPGSGTVASADGRGLLVLERTDRTRHHLDLGSRPRSLSWSADGGLLAITSQAAGLIVIDEHAERIAALPPSRRHLCAAWHDTTGPRQLAVAGAGSLRWLDPSLADPVTETRSLDGVTLTIASAPGGWIALGDLRGSITIANTDQQTDLQISGWPDPIRHLSWVGGTQHVVVAGGDQLTAWEPAIPPEPFDDETDAAPAPSNEPAHTSPDGSPLTWVAPHPWQPAVAAGTEAGTVSIWTPSTGERVDIPAFDDPVTSLAWDPLGDALAIGLRSGTVHFWTPHRMAEQ